jgi:hypothetical protein
MKLDHGRASSTDKGGMCTAGSLMSGASVACSPISCQWCVRISASGGGTAGGGDTCQMTPNHSYCQRERSRVSQSLRQVTPSDGQCESEERRGCLWLLESRMAMSDG